MSNSTKSTFTIEVTEEHVNKAFEEQKDAAISVITFCPLAQAVRPIIKGAWIAPGAIMKYYTNDSFVYKEWEGDQLAKRIVKLFDHDHLDELRELLPATVTFTRTR